MSQPILVVFCHGLDPGKQLEYLLADFAKRWLAHAYIRGIKRSKFGEYLN